MESQTPEKHTKQPTPQQRRQRLQRKRAPQSILPTGVRPRAVVRYPKKFTAEQRENVRALLEHRLEVQTVEYYEALEKNARLGIPASSTRRDRRSVASERRGEVSQ